MITTIPGDIPDLLRRGSPIIAADTFCGIVAEDPTGCSSTLVTLERAEDTMALRLEMIHALALDLTDPTGRAHAAAWIIRQRDGLTALRADRRIYSIIRACQDFADLDPREIDHLARLVLRLAGRKAP